MDEIRTMDGSEKVFSTVKSDEIPESATKMLQSVKDNPALWGRHGLKGNTGFVAAEIDGELIPMHMSATYDADGKVFADVKVDDPETDDELGTWARVEPEEAKAKGLKVIKCSYEGCDKPAVRLDHFHPYHDEMTNCEEHMDWAFKKGRRED